ncbi:MAG: GXWXG domain-containing protein [Pseudomonadota bacterium]
MGKPLDAGQGDALSLDAAISLFDEAEPATLEQMIGRWRGRGVDTGHPMDGMLEAASWTGKEFCDASTVFPLLHHLPLRGEVRLNPARLPIGLVMGLPARDKILPIVFPFLAPLFMTKRPAATLRHVGFRGRAHAAMVYDALPIIDYFASLSPDTVLGWMERRGDSRPFFFKLTREMRVQ